MRYLLIICALCLTGCIQTAYRANPGAACAVILAPAALVRTEFKKRGGTVSPNLERLDGFYDALTKETWIVGTRQDAEPVRVALHEALVHFVADQGGDSLEAAARLTGPTWNVLARDSGAQAEAMARALQLAAKVKL